jgi:hypothetical protein
MAYKDREKGREANRKYHEAHREQERASGRKYYAEHNVGRKSKFNVKLLDNQDKKLLLRGFTPKEVANILSVPKGTVTSRNRDKHHIDIHLAFAQRIQREGLPNNLFISSEFGYWFSGLFDGEGCLVANKDKRGSLHIAAQIAVRVDDTEMLRHVQRHLGGKLSPNNPKPPSRPKVQWSLRGGIETLIKIIIPLFDQYPLHSKKRLEYTLWRQVVIMYYMATLGGESPIHITTLPDRAEFNIESDRLCAEIHTIRFPDNLQPFKN